MPQPPHSLARRPRRRASGVSFVLPYVALLLVFGIAPTVYGLVTAFSVTPVIGDSYFSLTENFRTVLTDYRTGQAALNVLLYLVIWLPLLLVLVFGIALVMDARRTRFAALTRFVSYVPGAVTGSAAALLWLFIFTPGVSPVGPLLQGFASREGTILSDGSLPVVLAVMGVAAGAGGWIVLLFGALTAIPADILDAARTDGANAWAEVVHIKLPILRKYAAFILIVSLANGFQVFVEPQVLGAGVKGQISSTWSLNQLVYSYAANQSDFGLASALSMILLAVTLAAAVLVIKRTSFYSIDGDA